MFIQYWRIPKRAGRRAIVDSPFVDNQQPAQDCSYSVDDSFDDCDVAVAPGIIVSRESALNISTVLPGRVRELESERSF